MSDDSTWEKVADPVGFDPLKGLNPVVAARLKKEKEEAALREKEKLEKNKKDKVYGSGPVLNSSEVVAQADDAEPLTKGDFRKVIGQINDSFSVVEESLEKSNKLMLLMVRVSKEIIEIIEKPKK